MMLWNYSGDRKDIENQLPDYIRDVPHLITGLKNENGDPYVLTFNTPLNAAENVMAINQLPRRIADVINGYESFDEAMLDQVKSTLKAPLKTVVGLTNSLFKAPVEAFANQNFFTGGKIVPERLPDSEQLKGKMKYVASQLFTPIGTIQRFQDQELSPDATIASGILNQYLNVPKIFGKYADLSRNARNQVYENATEAVNAQKEQKFAIENTYLDYALGKISKEQFKQAAKESGLTQEQVRNIAESPRVNIAIIDEKLKNERDTNKRRLLDEEKSKWQKIMQAQRIEFLPKSVRKEVMEGR
jgi:hypothetical protein